MTADQSTVATDQAALATAQATLAADQQKEAADCQGNGAATLNAANSTGGPVLRPEVARALRQGAVLRVPPAALTRALFPPRSRLSPPTSSRSLPPSKQ